MGFETLLLVLGIEPITALAIGVTAGVAGVAGAVLVQL